MISSNYIEEALVFLINLAGFWLAFWVYSSNKKNSLNQWFTLMTFFDIAWVDFVFLANQSRDAVQSTIFYRANVSFVSLFLISIYYFFVLYFFKEKDKHPLLEKIVLIFGIFFSFLSIFSNLIINNTIIRDWGADAVFGKGEDLFSIYATFVAILIIGFTIKKYIHLSKDQKLKVQYFSVGVFFLAICNIIFNVATPLLTGNTKYARFGDYSAIIFLAFTAYATTKNNLLGVKALLAQVLIMVMASLLAFDIIFLSSNTAMRLLKVSILITFLYYSWELLSNMKKEKDVMERISKANLNLAERNKDLNMLIDVSNMVNEDLNSKRISQAIVDSVPKNLGYLGYVRAVIVLNDDKKDAVYVYAVTNSVLTQKIDEEVGIAIRGFRESLSGDDLIIKTIKDKKIYTSSKLSDFYKGFMDESKNRQVQKLLKAKSIISVPLFSSGLVIGAILFSNTNRLDFFTERNKDIVKAFASHIGPAIENARLYETTNQQIVELAKLNKSTKKANAKLEELLKMKNEFLHITSHQLRTPLTAIRGMISMWLEGDYDKLPGNGKDEMLKRIYVSTERLNNITNDMLDALELEGGSLKMVFQKTSIVEMIKDTIATLKPNFDMKGLYLRFGQVDDDIPDVDVEPNYMAQVFMNLIDNGCRYTRTGGVEIDVKKNKEYVVVYIRDTGVGINPKDQKKIFEKFTRGENAMVENASGSGLGLFIVKKILDEHNGEIEVISEGAGKGTTFKVSILIKEE